MGRLVVPVGIALFVVAAPVQAAPSNDEETLIRHGIELRKAQDDLAARAEFQKAYDLAHSPRAAAQLGLAEFALGRWDDAEAHVGDALRAVRDPWIEKYRAALERSLASIKVHVAHLEVTGEPTGAEVYVNGRLAGQLPLGAPVAVSEGQVDVELRARGFTRLNRTVTLAGGQYQRLVMRLERESTTNTSADHNATTLATPAVPINTGAAATAASTAPTGTDASFDSRPAVSLTDDSEGTAPSVGRRVAKWTSLGLAGAALATGITETVIYNRNFSTFQNLRGGACYDDRGVAREAAGNPAADCQASLDAYSTARTWLIVGYVGAGVFAATWLVLALTEPPSNGRSASHAITAWTCAPTLSAAGAACVARF
jgi:hypothetical protein